MKMSERTVGPWGHKDNLAYAGQKGAEGMSGSEPPHSSVYCSDSHFFGPNHSCMLNRSKHKKLTANYLCYISNKSRLRISLLPLFTVQYQTK